MPPVNRLFVGVDPGVSGAVAIIDNLGTLCTVFDLPFCRSANRYVLDYYRVIKKLNRYCNPDTTDVWIEYAHSMPRDSVVNAFTNGFVAGSIHTVFHVEGYIISYVRPAVWKRLMGISVAAAPNEDPFSYNSKRLRKQVSMDTAKALVPESEPYIQKSSHHNRADAILLALFGRRYWFGDIPVELDEHYFCHPIRDDVFAKDEEEETPAGDI
ncbi:MAG: hypothetical protein QXI19_05825 [Candidatus Caldarchaeum sp.]